MDAEQGTFPVEHPIAELASGTPETEGGAFVPQLFSRLLVTSASSTIVKRWWSSTANPPMHFVEIEWMCSSLLEVNPERHYNVHRNHSEDNGGRPIVTND